jgi:Domain of unknown function DUF87.
MELVIGKDGDHDVAVDAQELVTGRTCIIAQSGAGKSWGIAVICEQLLQARVGFCLVDTEGEYSSLAERFSSSGSVQAMIVTWGSGGQTCGRSYERRSAPERR